MKKGISYFGTRDLRWVKKDLDEIKRAKFSYIIHTFSEEDLRYYRQNLKEIIYESKKRNLEVFFDPWGVGKYFGGEPPSFFTSEYPEECIVIKNKRKPVACPNSKKFRNLLKEWSLFSIETGADGIFMDEPKLIDEKCLCKNCKGKNLKDSGIKLLKWIAELWKKENKKVSICLLPYSLKKDFLEIFFKSKNFDIIGTDPYPVLFNKNFDRESKNAISILKDYRGKYKKEIEIWIQAFKLKKKEENYIKKFYEFCKKEKIDRVSFWAFMGCYEMGHLRCERPFKVWEIIKKLY